MQTNPSIKSPEQEQFEKLVAKFLIELTEEFPLQAKTIQEPKDLFSQRSGKSINRIEIPSAAVSRI